MSWILQLFGIIKQQARVIGLCMLLACHWNWTNASYAMIVLEFERISSGFSLLLHPSTVLVLQRAFKKIPTVAQVSYQEKKCKAKTYITPFHSSAPWEFLSLPLPHHLLHNNHHCHTSSATIAYPAVSHPFGLVWFDFFRDVAQFSPKNLLCGVHDDMTYGGGQLLEGTEILPLPPWC